MKVKQLGSPVSGLTYLMLAAFFLLFIMLGSREIWTQEHRWADVVNYMFYSHDFLHPMLNGNEYYDKPLLSYWLVAGIATITHHLTTWTIRLPSALAGVVSVLSLYQIGFCLKNKQTGLLAAWLFLTTFYFIFWSRVGSTDMLNVAGILFALAWYFAKSNQESLFVYFIFGLIVATSALFKGLVAPVVIFLAILPHLFLQKIVKRHLLNWRLYAGFLPGLIIYLLPFLASDIFANPAYHSHGLDLVYRENMTRYFHPFDHQDPIYIYFIYLPLFLLPWAPFFLMALLSRLRNIKSISIQTKWLLWVLGLLFLFFTGCGSRRGYYVLPLIPFAILLIADWYLDQSFHFFPKMIMMVYAICVLFFGILQPWYYAKGGVRTFPVILKKEVEKIKPWAFWRFSLLDAETKMSFYLALSPDIKNYGIVGLREKQTLASLQKKWPPLTTLPKNTILVTRRQYEIVLNHFLKEYTLVEAEPTYAEWLTHKKNPDAPIAYVPNKFY